MAEEQVTNNASHDEAVSSIENMFMRREGVEPAPKPRAPDGKFVATKKNDSEEPVLAEAPGTEQQEEVEGQEPAQAEPAQSEETVEVEFDLGESGKETYALPKKIADRFIQHADYTRKTQDLAELRRVTSAEREATNLEKAFSQQTQAERQQMALLDAQIAQYQGLNWGSIEDTGQLIKLREQLNQLKDQRAEVEGKIKAKRGEFDERIKGLTQEAVSAGLKYIQQNIKGYDAKAEKALKDYAQSVGFHAEELSRVIDPRLIVMLWKASQWDGLQSSQAGVLKRVAQAAPVVRPGATQKTVTRVQQAAQAIKKATTQKGKQQATEDYFAARFGER